MANITLEIHRPDKPTVKQEIEQGVYPVGSGKENTIILPGPDVSSRHAVLSLKEGDCWVEDLDSNTGTYIDSSRVQGHATLVSGQKVAIGQYVIIVNPDEVPAEAEQPPAEQKVPEEAAAPVIPEPTPDVAAAADVQQRISEVAAAVGPAQEEGKPNPRKISEEFKQKQSVKKQIHGELVKRLNLKRLTVANINEEDLHKQVRDTIDIIIKETETRLPKGLSPKALSKELYDEAVGLGPLEDLLSDEDVTEIMVNGHDRVYVEKKGRLVLTESTFLDDSSVLAIIERIVSPLGRRIDESQPYVDARLQDGSRVNAIIHPLSLVGPCLTIRKFSKVPFTDKDLVRFGTLVPLMAEFVRACVLVRKNIIISGGTGSGKTTLLNVFSTYLPDDERIVTIEDAAELRLTQDHAVRLEARPANIEGRGAITIRDLVRNALRMRPDRIVVGECRGGESLDMLQAMNTGHDGSLTTVHANSPRDVISRLETMVLMSGMDLPVRAIREQVASAIDLIVHESRMSDGTRKVVNISEVVGIEGERVTMQDIFEFEQTGIEEDGRCVGRFKPTGSVPTFVKEFKARNIEIDQTMFDPQRWQE